jgi:hypothetical protein
MRALRAHLLQHCLSKQTLYRPYWWGSLCQQRTCALLLSTACPKSLTSTRRTFFKERARMGFSSRLLR